MDRELGDKHVVVMASFTAAAVVAASAYGFKRLLHKRGKKQSVQSANMGIMVDFEEREIKENAELSEINKDKHVESSTTVPLPISLPPYGITDSDEEKKHDDKPMDKGKEERDLEMEKLNACLKELQEKMAKLGSQQSDINELKKKMKVDEEKIDKLLWQEDEINKLKTKITEDENQIREMQKELIMLREKQNKKKGNWWNANRVSVVNDVAASEFDKTKKLQHKK